MTDMISLQIVLACQEPGCPLCRLRYASERRCLFGFLWEEEYVRKHIHEYRHEPMSKGEQTSWIRAVAWFAGEKRLTDAEATRHEQRHRLKIAQEVRQE